MRMKSRHWMIAVVMAIALHASITVAMFWPRTEDGAQAPGIGGIEIALGPAGGAPGGPEDAPETPDLEEQPEEPTEAPPAEETAEPEPPEPPEPIAEPEPVEPEDLSERVIEPPVPVAKPKPPSEAVPAAVIAPEPPVEREPQTAGAGGKAGSEDSTEAGASGSDMSAGGRPGAVADYSAIVLAWLERHKEYPRGAQQRRQEGVVLLFIAIDREGRVLEARIEQSSGRDVLDQAALDMLERAAPLPPVPDDMPQQRLEMVVPVQFFIT
ncbi:energy transducer TonB [Pelagibius sp.]|uniref:energy transducer TonB n=1 Tax=Pelagibius sp. TaxID=1931238 RepID=UPI003BB0B2B5